MQGSPVLHDAGPGGQRHTQLRSQAQDGFRPTRRLCIASYVLKHHARSQAVYISRRGYHRQEMRLHAHHVTDYASDRVVSRHTVQPGRGPLKVAHPPIPFGRRFEKAVLAIQLMLDLRQGGAGQQKQVAGSVHGADDSPGQSQECGRSEGDSARTLPKSRRPWGLPGDRVPGYSASFSFSTTSCS